MKLILVLLTLTLTAACASKTKTGQVTAAKTETPSSMKATPTVKVEAKKEEKHSTKKSHAKTIVSAEAKATTGSAELVCKSGSDERKLNIQVKDSGCELQYTKAGETKVIASQISGSEKCEEVMTSVKEKLVASGFTCP